MSDREKFEKLAAEKGWALERRGEGYFDRPTDYAWISFQAALSSRDSTPTEGGDRALAAPRMTLDLTRVGPFDSLLDAIRQQLPNIEFITHKEPQ